MVMKPYNADDEDNPYSQAGVGSDSTATPADGPASRAAPASTPQPYTPPSTTPEAPPPTFAQQEAQGVARPPEPAPVPHLSPSRLPGATDMGGGQAPATSSPVPAAPVEHVANNGAHYTGPQYYQPDPSQPDYQPNDALPWAPTPAPAPAPVASAPTPYGPPHIGASQLPGITDAGGQVAAPPAAAPNGDPIGAMLGIPDAGSPTPEAPPPPAQQTAPNGAVYTGPQYYQPDPSKPDYQPNTALPWAPDPTPAAAPPVVPPPLSPSPPVPDAAPVTPAAAPSATDSLLPLLTGHAEGTTTTPLQDATTQATLDQLKSPNPFNSDEVKREYGDLGAGIDADYDQRQRGLSNDFARRGLFGSVGKDFASGRAADTEIGRRTAKTQLASDLAKAQAVSQGQYQSNAISQGQAGTQQGQGNQLAWLQSLMGYGNDAFNHDLQTAQFQEGQNNDEQDYLLKLLEAGYGV